MTTKKDFLELEMYVLNILSIFEKRLQNVENSYMTNKTALKEFASTQRKIDQALAKYDQLELKYTPNTPPNGGKIA